MKEDKKEDITSTNDNGELHGYQEWYDSIGSIYHRGTRKNIERVGYQEWHNFTETDFNIR